MASVWLDVARYADTFGYQNDVAMQVWPWREWVIKAFNRNMPYDQFITEQIAGDMLPNATQDQQLATTFNRLHRQTNEGGSIAEEFRLAGINDRTTTAGTALLGLTFECSRCHDHKFDPIKSRDFYRLSAYFSDIDEFGLYSHFTFSQPTPAMLLYQGKQRRQHEAALADVRSAESEFKQIVQQARAHWTQRQDMLIRSLPDVRKPVVHMSLDGDSKASSGEPPPATVTGKSNVMELLNSGERMHFHSACGSSRACINHECWSSISRSLRKTPGSAVCSLR